MKTPITLVDDENGNKRLTMPGDLSSHLTTHAYLYLQPNGWFNDYPCDEEGITPWMTFPAISFLKDILSKEHKIFEYGIGYSTAFFHQYVGQVSGVEHDQEWIDKVKYNIPNADIHHAPENEMVHEEAVELVNDFIKNFPQIRSDNREHDLKHGLVNDEFAGYASKLYEYEKGYFDIIVLDGMARSLTGVMAVERLKEGGMIILDNSDRWHYNSLQQHLATKGFKRIDFWGPGFNSHHAWCTSIFSKNLPFSNHRLERPVTEGLIFT